MCPIDYILVPNLNLAEEEVPSSSLSSCLAQSRWRQSPWTTDQTNSVLLASAPLAPNATSLYELALQHCYGGLSCYV